MTTQAEIIVSMPVRNPEGGGTSRTFRYLGKVDLLEDAKLIDYKFVADINRQVARTEIGYQPECYTMALRNGGEQVAEVAYRIVARPSLRMRSGETDEEYAMRCEERTPLKRRKSESNEDYNKRNEERTPLKRKPQESPEEFEDRCLEWLLEGDAIRMIEFSNFLHPDRLLAAQHWLWECGKQILECRRASRWLVNGDACYAYNRACEYLPLCSAVARGDDVQPLLMSDYEECDDTHVELDGAASKEDKDVITYSSLCTLCQCQRKYLWRYELGVKRRGLDNGEALKTGTLAHKGMEKWKETGSEEDALASIRSEREWVDVITPGAYEREHGIISKAAACVRAAIQKWG